MQNNRVISIVIIAIFSFLIGGCAVDYQKLSRRTKDHPIQERDYFSMLASGYKQIADRRAELENWRDADHFARKSLDAMNKIWVIPEDPRKWQSNYVATSDALVVRQTIIDKITESNVIHRPIDLSNLVLGYDYWLFASHSNQDVDELVLIKNELLFMLDEFGSRKVAADMVDKTLKLDLSFGQKYLSKKQKHAIDVAAKKLMNSNIFNGKIIIRSYHNHDCNYSNQRLKEIINELESSGHNISYIQVVKYKTPIKNHIVDIDFVAN